MSQVVNIIYIFIYSCDICNIRYLLLTLYCALILFWGWRLSTERVVAQPLYLFRFAPRCESAGDYQAYYYLVLIYIDL